MNGPPRISGTDSNGEGIMGRRETTGNTQRSTQEKTGNTQRSTQETRNAAGTSATPRQEPTGRSEGAGKSSTTQTDRERGTQRSQEAGQGTSVTRQEPSGLAYGSGSPFAVMRRFAEDMDRLFGDFGFGGRALGLSPLGSTLGRDLWGSSPFEETAWAPQVEVVQRGDRLVIRADLPGLRKDDIDIDIDKGVLTLRGERQQVHEDTSEGYYRSERRYGAFSRSIPLPDGADATRAEATFKDGVLEVIVPAPQRAERSRKIEIR